MAPQSDSALSRAYDLLSKKGKKIYFPYKGILGQSAEAKGTEINATIGVAFEEDGSPLTLECIEEMTTLPSNSFLYAPSFGLPDLRATWKDSLYKKNPGLEGKLFSNPVVTNALTHGLSTVGFLFVDEGDEILLPDLFWDNYELVFKESFGAELKFYQTFVDGKFNVDGLGKALLEEGGKKIVILNYPNNPAGYTVTDEEAAGIRDAVRNAAEKGKTILVVLDDAYFGLVYEEGVYRESMFSLLCDLHSNVLAVKLDGATKEDYVWGLRVGFITYGIKNGDAGLYKDLEDKTAGAVRAMISNNNNLGQQLLLKAYKHPDYAAQKENKYSILKARYEKIKQILAGHPEYTESFEPMPFNSGYFMCVRIKGAEPEAVRKELLSGFRTGVIVISGLVRLAFSCVPLEKLDKLFANLDGAVRNIKKR